MRERDYPKFGSSPRDYLPPEHYTSAPNPVLPPGSFNNMLDQLDEAHAADVRAAVEEAAAIASDVHLYRKRGSQFLCIGFHPATADSVRVFEYPEMR